MRLGTAEGALTSVADMLTAWDFTGARFVGGGLLGWDKVDIQRVCGVVREGSAWSSGGFGTTGVSLGLPAGDPRQTWNGVAAAQVEAPVYAAAGMSPARSSHCESDDGTALLCLSGLVQQQLVKLQEQQRHSCLCCCNCTFECVQSMGVISSGTVKHANTSQLDRLAQGLASMTPMAVSCYQAHTQSCSQ